MSAKISRRALAGAALVAPVAACATTLDISPSFDRAWAEHVAAIQARDLSALETTLTGGETLILILPNGVLTTRKSEFLDFHRQWFASTTWRMRFEEQWTKQSTTTAQILFRTHYQEVGNGAPIEWRNYLIMTFEREMSGWKLIADQNTRIPA